MNGKRLLHTLPASTSIKCSSDIFFSMFWNIWVLQRNQFVETNIAKVIIPLQRFPICISERFSTVSEPLGSATIEFGCINIAKPDI